MAGYDQWQAERYAVPVVEEPQDPNRDGGYWTRKGYSVYEGFHRYNMMGNLFDSTEKFLYQQFPFVIRKLEDKDPNELDAQGNPVGYRDAELPSAPEFDEYRKDWLKWMGMSREQRSEVFTKAKDAELKKKAIEMGLGDVTNERGALINPSLFEMGLNFGVALASPEVLIPFANGVKGAMISGSILAATDNYLYQSANEVEVNSVELGLVAAGGAALAGVATWAGPKFYNWFVKRRADKQPVTKEEVLEQLGDAYNSLETTEVSQKAAMTGRIGDDAEMIADMMNNSAVKEVQPVRSTDMVVWEAKENIVDTTVTKVLDRLEGPANIQSATKLIGRLLSSDVLTKYEGAVLQGDEAVGKLMASLSKKDKDLSAKAAKELGFETPTDMVDFFYRGGRRRSDYKVINHYRKVEKLARDAKNEAFDRVEKEQAKTIATREKDLVRGMKKSKKEAEASSAKQAWYDEVLTKQADEEAKIWEDTLLAEEVSREENVMTRIMAKQTDEYKYIAEQARNQVEQAMKGYANKQRGSIGQNLLIQSALPMAGGAVGFASNEENRLAGLVTGIAMGYAPIGIMKIVGRQANHMPPFHNRWTRMLLAMQSKNIIVKPWSYLPKLGPAGEKLAYAIRRASNFVDRSTSRMRAQFVNVANDADVTLSDPKVGAELIDILTKKTKPSSPQMARVAGVLKDQFDSILGEMRNVGLITTETYQAVKSARSIQGFWPVVLDDSKIATSMDGWVEYFSQREFNEEALLSVVKSISSIKDYKANKVQGKIIARGISATDGKPYAQLTPTAARDLWYRRKTNPFTILHTGSEDTTGLRSILEPWLSKDIASVTTDYFNYAQRRIAFAKEFGGTTAIKKADGTVVKKFDKDLVMKSLVSDIWNDTGANATMVDYAEQVYYGAQHSALSRNIRAAGERAPWAANLEGKAMALNTMLLSLAQVLNAGQSVLFSSILLGKYGVNPIHALWITSKQVVRTFKNKSEVLADTGAAIETTLVQQLGEMSTSAHTVFGREFSNKNPIEWLQNPSKFLKLIGFIQIEEFNRALAANVGEVTALRLASQKIAMEQAGEIGTKQYKRVLGWMEELGMDTKRKLSHVDEIRADELRNTGQIAEASLNFSNEVNFRNTATQMPLLWSHPNAKLVRQFKTFMLHHASFMWRNVGQEALKGNLYPLAIFLTAAPAVGAVLHETRQGVKRTLQLPKKMASGEIKPNFKAAAEWVLTDDSELTGLQKYITYLSAVGGAGLWSELLNELQEEGPSGALRTAAGPTLTRGYDLGADVHRELQQVDWSDGPAEVGGQAFNAVAGPLYEEVVRGGLGGVSRALLPSYTGEN